MNKEQVTESAKGSEKPFKLGKLPPILGNDPCVFSSDKSYRYTLWRQWDKQAEYLNVIGCNPSTADDQQDDPTIRRCIGFAKTLGFGGLCMTNIFGFRATDPEVMKAHAEPIGDRNDHWLRLCATAAGMVIVAWSNHGTHRGRAAEVCALLAKVAYQYPKAKPVCLAVNKDGSPKHPLYIRADTKPRAFATSIFGV